MSARRNRVAYPLAIEKPSDLIFGRAPRPVAAGRGVTIGGGTVYPEINFTLPTMLVEEATWPEVRRQYTAMIGGLVERALRLAVPGLIVELEHLPPMTERPSWGAEITAILREALEAAHAKRGLPFAIRATIIDLRETTRPPRLRSGPHWDAMRESSILCARAGADILSIESVGGKEVHDRALVFGDIRGILYALGVLAARDMEWLWGALVEISRATGMVPGGDSACGFGNTAMQLANQGQLPQTLAAVIRAMTAARSLVAFECGAIGPSKDCAYEGNVLKVISGCPISMEGKSAACAHSSPLGNIACMAADLWSNESVQNVKLLAGPAPEAFLEILAYDCRLLNLASRRGIAPVVRDLLVESDELLSPQALVLGPEATFEIARAIVDEAADDYRRTLAAGRAAVSLLRRAVSGRIGGWTEGGSVGGGSVGETAPGAKLELSPQEARWLDRIERELDRMPQDPSELEAEIAETYGELFVTESYGLPGAAKG